MYVGYIHNGKAATALLVVTVNTGSDTVDAGSFLKILYLPRSRNLPLLWNPLSTAVITKPRCWLNPLAVESSPQLYAAHFQDSNTALLSYLGAVLHSCLFPHGVRVKFCIHNPPIRSSHYGTCLT
jgi:hypothetical protein